MLTKNWLIATSGGTATQDVTIQRDAGDRIVVLAPKGFIIKITGSNPAYVKFVGNGDDSESNGLYFQANVEYFFDEFDEYTNNIVITAVTGETTVRVSALRFHQARDIYKESVNGVVV